jgi:predicted DCC family thiol-disulfide oxidoreductase YuxK
MENKGIIIFDGVCNFCNHSVDFIMKNDKQKYFLFTANQQEAGKKILAEKGIPSSEVNTIYLYEKGNLYKESTAALRIAQHLSFPYNMLSLFLIVPPFIRNGVYKFIARNRYKWFGKNESCRIPSAAERARFLN